MGAEELPCIQVRNVKLFCNRCEAAEVFAPLWYDDMKTLAAKLPYQKPFTVEGDPSAPRVQLFSLLYQCQRCKGEPAAFIVRREGFSLYLHGRSPMEQVQAERHIPKKEREFFLDAVIAMHAGHALAGLFYLRTFIEQFARRQTGMLNDRATGDQIMDAYAKTLPPKERDLMPSLREWYDKISEALHTARADDALFQEAREEIERHFDIRRVHKIADASVNQK
jgi:hypothetical protein